MPVMRAETAGGVPPEGEPLEFVRNKRTGRVHILRHLEDRAPGPAVSFAEGLAKMFTTPRKMLCPVRLRVGGFDDFPGTWVGGDHFTDDDLCVACVQALGDQQWRAFHVDNRGPS